MSKKNKVVLTSAEAKNIAEIILDELGKVDKDYQIGWFEEATYKDEYKGEAIPVAQVAKWHEYGYHHPGAIFAKRIIGIKQDSIIGGVEVSKRDPQVVVRRVKPHDVPPRPMLNPVINKYGKKALEVIAKAVSKNFSLNTALKQGAQFLLDRVKMHITNMHEPPNRPLTIFLKGSSHPMIDTGYLRNALRINEVKKTGKK